MLDFILEVDQDSLLDRLHLVQVGGGIVVLERRIVESEKRAVPEHDLRSGAAVRREVQDGLGRADLILKPPNEPVKATDGYRHLVQEVVVSRQENPYLDIRPGEEFAEPANRLLQLPVDLTIKLDVPIRLEYPIQFRKQLAVPLAVFPRKVIERGDRFQYDLQVEVSGEDDEIVFRTDRVPAIDLTDRPPQTAFVLGLAVRILLPRIIDVSIADLSKTDDLSGRGLAPREGEHRKQDD
jgi:hypothetical protein